MCSDDLEEFRQRTGLVQRKKVAEQAGQKGIKLPADFLTVRFRDPCPILFTEALGRFAQETEDLGDLRVKIIHVPGHTPGSIVLYLEKYRLLLTGDNWNPCTWMWFPSSIPANCWRDNMKELIRDLETESGQEIETVLCSHQPSARKASEIKSFLTYMSDERIGKAPDVDMGAPIHTCEIRKEPEGWILLFDKDKT